MPSRSDFAELARLLGASSRPIYLVDSQRRIAYCNEACERWFGIPGEQLIGVECRYHSGDALSPAEAVAAALCPPPAALAGDQISAQLTITDAGQRESTRRTLFMPLADDGGDSAAVLAIVSDIEEPPDKSGRSIDELNSVELHHRLAQHRRRMQGKYGVDSLLGISPAIVRVRAQIELAAASEVHVALSGPAGSGRQHVARMIHYNSAAQAIGPLVPLACHLLGPELLGTTITALIHSEEHREEGQRPALLLNAADALPADAQVALAERLAGGRMPLRIISAAGEPLVALAARGGFREDLACALSTISIELPPLADRLEDLPLLAQAFLERINAGGEKQLGGFTSRALDRLAAYPWPDGLDELVDVVRESHQQADSHQVTVDDLPRRVRFATDTTATPRGSDAPIVMDDFLGDIEKELITRALERAKGNKTKAAALVGMNRPRFYRRLVQLGLVDSPGAVDTPADGPAASDED